MKIFEIEIFQLWVQYGSIQYFFLRLVCIFGASRTETQLVLF